MDLAALLQPKLPLEYNDILRTVGEQEGFKNFLLGDESSSSPRLAKHASPGPIVNLNQTKYRADALITTFKGVISIPLPDFTYDKCIEHEALVLDARRVMATEPDRASTQMNTVLTWLWVAVAEPVLEKLNITGSLDAHQKLPRIWWLSNKWTGLFSYPCSGRLCACPSDWRGLHGHGQGNLVIRSFHPSTRLFENICCQPILHEESPRRFGGCPCQDANHS